MTTLKSFVLANIVLTCAVCGSLSAQTQIRGEYIESSSPTRGGGNVTTRAEPGRRVQTTITMPRNASPRVATNPQQAPTAARSNNSVLDSSGAGSTISQPAQGATSDTAGRYPYPAPYSPRVAANPFQPNPNANRVNASRPQLLQGNNCNCAPAPAFSGLGLIPAPRFNNAVGGRVMPTAAFQPQAGFNGGAFQQAPLVGQGVQPVLSQAPQLQIQMPGQNQVGAQPFSTGQIGVPQLGNQQANWTRSPWLSGSPNAYRPLVGIFNMPQGSYLGQGIIGQPEAYVNGQPVANFFRYLFPF